MNEEDLQQAIIIMLIRNYDVNIALLAETNPEKAQQIAAEHQAGGLYYPEITFDPKK